MIDTLLFVVLGLVLTFLVGVMAYVAFVDRTGWAKVVAIVILSVMGFAGLIGSIMYFLAHLAGISLSTTAYFVGVLWSVFSGFLLFFVIYGADVPIVLKGLFCVVVVSGFIGVFWL
ncbi:hypothetical protein YASMINEVIRUS_738 [Yasminevirus sp. GU-2018]|uniref:Uncharacterized protein n=1 Tax=Yasminevirus sp. GU-2018 TaxID=2420051 RepID=A0A5K0U8Z6_9VIRU|nr:hypothetical protein YASMINEVIRUS_738 [Yasminevirus sp. GU-2018]